MVVKKNIIMASRVLRATLVACMCAAFEVPRVLSPLRRGVKMWSEKVFPSEEEANLERLKTLDTLDYEEEESYESKWRKRRIASLKIAPEIIPSDLEDLFEPDYLQKKLIEQSPNIGFGAIFKFEGVVCDLDIVPVYRLAWATVAAEFRYPEPDERTVAYVLEQAMRDEIAIERVFRWTRDWAEARRMSQRCAELLKVGFNELELKPLPNVGDWLRDLKKEGIPCACVTKLPRKTLESCLHSLNYTEYFTSKSLKDIEAAKTKYAEQQQTKIEDDEAATTTTTIVIETKKEEENEEDDDLKKITAQEEAFKEGKAPFEENSHFDLAVTAEDERDLSAQAFLHAALTIERQPSRCVVFTDTMGDLVGAHEAEMRAVGIVGRHPAYDLHVADLVVRDLSDLRLQNIRRLFADRDFDELPPGFTSTDPYSQPPSYLQRETQLEPETAPLRQTQVLDREEDFDDYDDDDDDYY